MSNLKPVIEGSSHLKPQAFCMIYAVICFYLGFMHECVLGRGRSSRRAGAIAGHGQELGRSRVEAGARQEQGRSGAGGGQELGRTSSSITFFILWRTYEVWGKMKRLFFGK